MSGHDRIAAAFAARSGKAALMPYLMGGYPTLDDARRIGDAYADHGADLVELGVPFSDPLADGPVIHAAATEALGAGATLTGVLQTCEELAARLPVVLMAYANVAITLGAEAFAARVAAAGASGVIVPDLPLEEAPELRDALDRQDVALVPLIAPTTTEDRLARIGAAARGFLYTVSVVGITGERAALADDIGPLLTRAKGATEVPVALGFGISTPAHAVEAADAGADGVIVASRIMRAVAEGSDPARDAAEALAPIAEALR